MMNVLSFATPELREGERILECKSVYSIIALSFACSWLGAYTSCQIISHANSVGRGRIWWAWVGLASLTFGWVSIWSLHFLGTLSAEMDVPIELDRSLTVLSAVVATGFTFAAFSSDSGSSRSHGWCRTKFWRKHFRGKKYIRDTEQRSLEEGLLERRLSNEFSDAVQERTAAIRHDATERGRLIAGEETIDPDVLIAAGLEDEFVTSPTLVETANFSADALLSEESTSDSVPARPPRLPGLPSSTISSSDSHSRSGLTTSSGSGLEFPTELSSDPELHLLLNRTTKKRLISGAYRAQLTPTAFLNEIYEGFNLFIAFKGGVWAAAVVSMHHIGMAALEIPDGRVHWNPFWIILSCFIAFVVTSIACICVRHMEVHFARQVLFSTIASLGVFAFHYTSVLGVTFITTSPPDPLGGGYPRELPFTITALAITTCVVSSAMLAHNATLSRNRLAELVLTKRRMWRIIAEKEAVAQAAEVKQNFISVASHELRTPLFSVTGYAELLARTDLSEEQAMYLANVQQACQNMSLIISNVLDFSKLERDNAESTARPVRVNPRTMLEGIIRMTGNRGIDSSASGVDIIVSVSDAVPETLFLDEAYTVRVLINLLSNAVKFTEAGYILLTLDIKEQELVFKVTDTGIGIPARFRKSLFEPYRQADSSLTRLHQGTGLGLSICKQLVERLSGDISVSSVEGEGTTFTVTLPVTNATPPPTTLPRIRPNPPRIAIACHNLKTQKLLGGMFAAQNYTISSVEGRSSQELVNDADIIWCDFEVLKQSETLRQLLITNHLAKKMSPILLVTSTVSDVSTCTGLLEATNVILLREPGIVLHRIMPMLEAPMKHLSNPAPPTKVLRFSDTTESVSEQEIPTAPSTEKRRVLLVEDNAVNRLLGRRILEKMDYSVITAQDGREAVKRTCEGDVDIILMDCQMPIMDGHAATRAIRALEASGKIRNRIPIIALTANVTAEAEASCRNDGMDDFLAKPLKLDDLKAMLVSHLMRIADES